MLSRDVAETERFGVKLGRTLTTGSVIALHGDLGAGKTALTRGIAKGLGISDLVTSPTFALVHVYTTGRLTLYHFDWYRLSTEDELFELGWEDYQDSGVCVVEWPERIPEALPPETVHLTITATGPSERSIVCEAIGL